MKPRIVVFDYGDTLVHETAFDQVAGNREVLAIAAENPLGVDAETLLRESRKLFCKAVQGTEERKLEIAWNDLSRLLYCRLGLEFRVPMDEIQLRFARSALTLRPVAGAGKLMQYLCRQNIETAVLSNTSFSSTVLGTLLADTVPECTPKFVMTSSEYVFLKPSQLLFEAMIVKTGYPKEAIWFCGNNLRRDALGAVRAGIKSILLDENGAYPKGREYTKITALEEIVDLVEQSKQ